MRTSRDICSSAVGEYSIAEQDHLQHGSSHRRPDQCIKSEGVEHLQDESNIAIRDKKKERNYNSKAHSDNRRLSQSVREMIRAKKVDEARRACEEQVIATGLLASQRPLQRSRASQGPVLCSACVPLHTLAMHPRSCSQ